MIDKNLIDKLLRGECSIEELEQLRRYWQGSDQPGLEGLLEKHWQSAGQSEEFDSSSLQERLWEKIESARVKPAPLIVSWAGSWVVRGAAAAAILLIALGAYWFFQSPAALSDQQLVERVNLEAAPMPVELEDGSVVWLKRESKLTYLEPFSEGQRSVQLTGEGFFEIAKDARRPFIVQTDHLDTRVLGTSFNLKAEAGDSIVQVALVEGSVEVVWDTQRDTAVRMSPGEQLTYHHEIQQVEKERFVSDAPYAWKNGVIYFLKADVKEVALTLEEWYGKHFVIKGDSLISGKLVHRYDTKKLTLNEVLQGISKVMDYRFEVQTHGDILILPKH